MDIVFQKLMCKHFPTVNLKLVWTFRNAFTQERPSCVNVIWTFKENTFHFQVYLERKSALACNQKSARLCATGQRKQVLFKAPAILHL